MKKFECFPILFSIVAVVVTLCGSPAFGQLRALGAGALVLDDGNGNTITLIPPPGLVGNYNYNLPASPGGNIMSGYVEKGFTAGQILYWNGTYWQPGTAGSIGQVLTLNGSGIPTWEAAGSGSFIDNQTSLQSSASFNIDGSGKVGTTLTAGGNINTTGGTYQIGGSTVLSDAGTANMFAGVGAGSSTTSGFDNTFFGSAAGGDDAGGADNTFIGELAGNRVTSGNGNTYIGEGAGFPTVTGSYNTLLGYSAGIGEGFTNATAIGADAQVGSSNTIVLGDNEVTSVLSYGTFNTFNGGFQTNGTTRIDNSGNGTFNSVNSATVYKIGGSTVLSDAGTANMFAGVGAGSSTTSGFDNTFFGSAAGGDDAGGADNTFIGELAGNRVTSGNGNTYIGEGAGFPTVTGSYNTLLGYSAGIGEGFTNATAIGADAQVGSSNTIVLGDNEVTSVLSYGTFNTFNGGFQTNGTTRIDNSGNGTFATIAVGTASALQVDVNGNLTTTGNILANATGTTSSLPSIMGFENPGFTSLHLVDQFNTIQSAQGDRVQLTSYWGLEFRGHTVGAVPSYATGASTDPNVNIFGTSGIDVPQLRVTRGSSGQTSALQQWTDQNGGVLASIDHSGNAILPALSASGVVTFSGLAAGIPANYLALDASNHLVLASGGGGGLSHITESYNNSVAPYSSTSSGEQLLASGAATNISIALQPKGAGALEAQIADNGAGGGNLRGQSAVDWQMVRNSNVEVASGNFATVSGGELNTASGGLATVSGGYQNIASGNSATVSGGESNTASSIAATVSGGYSNTASGDFSAIPGGELLTLSGHDDFGFLSGNDGNGELMSIAATQVSVFGNTDLWLADNDGTQRAIKFFEQYSSAGAFPNTAKWVGFEAPDAITTSIIWKLPVADGSANQVLQTNGAGVLSWVNNSGGSVSGTGTAGTIPLWTGTSSQGNSHLTDNGSTLTYSGTNITATNYQIGGTTVLAAPVTENLYVGLGAGLGNSGAANTFSGWHAGIATSGGGENTFSGAQAGLANTGSFNTFSGWSAGLTNVGGTHNTALGSSADMASGALSDATAIGYGAIASASNTIQLGDGNVTLVQSHGAFNTTAGGFQTNGTTRIDASGNGTLVALSLTGLSAGTPSNYLALDASNHVVLASGGGISGTGTAGTIPIWTGTSSQGNSKLKDNGATLSYSANHISSGGDYQIGASTVLSTPNGDNIFVGQGAGDGSGDNNTIMGYDADNFGSSNTMIGAYTGVEDGALSDATAIGFGAIIGSSNSIQLGDVNVTLVQSNGTFNTTAGGFQTNGVTRIDASGNGTFASVNSLSNYQIGGSTVLSTPNGDNIFVGQGAGDGSGDNNTILGFDADNFGSSNTMIGAYTGVEDGALSDATAIGFGAIIGISNAIQLGDGNVSSVSSNGSFNSTAGGFETNGATVIDNSGNGTLATLALTSLAAGTPANYLALDASNHVVLASGGGGGNYIDNGTSQQTSANFNIDGNGTIGGTLATGPTTITQSGNADALTIQTSSTSTNDITAPYWLVDFGGRATFAGMLVDPINGINNGSDAIEVEGFSGYRDIYGDNWSVWNSGAGIFTNGIGLGNGANPSANTVQFYNEAPGNLVSADLEDEDGGVTWTLPAATGTIALTDDITNAINGSTNYLAIFTSYNTLGTSDVTDDGTTLRYFGSHINTSGSYQIDGSTVLLTGSDPGDLFVGDMAGGGNLNSGQKNTFIGENAGGDNQDNASYNTFTGYRTGYSNTGNQNTFLGYGIATSNSGNNNTFAGYETGESNGSGHDNTFLGYASGASNQSGNYITILGDNADANDRLTDATAIGANAVVTASNTIQLGDGNVTSVNTAGVVTAAGLTITGNDGNDVLGTNDNWQVDGSGNAYFESLDIAENFLVDNNGGTTIFNYDQHGAITINNYSDGTTNDITGTRDNWYADLTGFIDASNGIESDNGLDVYGDGVYVDQNGIYANGGIEVGTDDVQVDEGDVDVNEGDVDVENGNLYVGDGAFEVMTNGTTTINEDGNNDALAITGGNGGNDITGTNDYWQVDGSGNGTYSSLMIDQSSSNDALTINGGGDGGNDITGTNDNWNVDGNGNIYTTGAVNSISSIQTNSVTRIDASGTFNVGGNLFVNTESDAESGGEVTITGSTTFAEITGNDPETVTVTVTNAATGQMLYLLNSTTGGGTLTLGGSTVAEGKIGIFVYYGGSWRGTN